VPYAIKGIRPDPTLEYDVMDAATAQPMRLTAATGVVWLVNQQSGIRVKGGADPREQFGFFVPGLIVGPGPDPLVIPELSLTQVGAYDGDLKSTRLYGISDLVAQVMPDPQQNGQRGVALGFFTVGGEPMVLRYRVTLYRPRG
jgi:hypothetical protein